MSTAPQLSITAAYLLATRRRDVYHLGIACSRGATHPARGPRSTLGWRPQPQASVVRDSFVVVKRCRRHERFHSLVTQALRDAGLPVRVGVRGPTRPSILSVAFQRAADSRGEL